MNRYKNRTINNLHSFIVLIALFFLANGTSAQSTDTIDVLHYDLRLDVGHQVSNRIVGQAQLDIKKLQTVQWVRLDLTNAQINAISLNGQPVDTTNYRYDSRNLQINTQQVAPGETFTLTIDYTSAGKVESYGWGGFHLDASIYYNLGVAFGEYPHGYGRSWFPCHDSFSDKATYTFRYTTPTNWTTTSTGQRDSCYRNDDGSETSHWVLNEPTPTYLISVAMGPFTRIERSLQGLNDTYPLTIAYRNFDSSAVANAFAQLDYVVPMFERCFGPYRWHTIGYTGTPKGSMEHVNNISLVNSAMATLDQSGQNVMAHELSHAWFGNLVTCATSYDMWINEGGASFCEEVAAEGVKGKTASNEVYLTNLEKVFRTTHIEDNGYKPLYGHTPEYTYGSTVYNKGATVWHSLRGYLGDSLFYASMRTLFDHNAFGNLDSWQLRDSLSLYSGVDLTSFFDFHVFGKGFVDYSLDKIEYACPSGESDPFSVTLTVRQKMVGQDDPTVYCHANRVPVTFFINNTPFATRIMEFDGPIGTQTFALNKRPDYAVLDYYQTLSDAVTDYIYPVVAKQQSEFPLAHIKTSVSAFTDSTLLHVAHHWSRPDGEWTDSTILNPGIIRMANRYWQITGQIPDGTKLRGYLHFAKSSINWNGLDRNFYTQSATFDSIEVLYREDPQHQWRVVKSNTSGNSSEGYFIVNPLLPGQYTLAVIDTSLLAINEPHSSDADRPFLCPNPCKGNCQIHIPDYEGLLTISIFDTTGKRQKTLHRVANNSTIQLTLNQGIYIVKARTEKGGTVFTQKLIVQ